MGAARGCRGHLLLPGYLLLLNCHPAGGAGEAQVQGERGLRWGACTHPGEFTRGLSPGLVLKGWQKGELGVPRPLAGLGFREPGAGGPSKQAPGHSSWGQLLLSKPSAKGWASEHPEALREPPGPCSRTPEHLPTGTRSPALPGPGGRPARPLWLSGLPLTRAPLFLRSLRRSQPFSNILTLKEVYPEWGSLWH